MNRTFSSKAVMVFLCPVLWVTGLAAAEMDLSAAAVMRSNNEASGYAFEEPFVYAGPIAALVDNKPESGLTEPTPYVSPWIVEAWFPGESPVAISRIAARHHTRAITRWSLQAWAGGAEGTWRTLASCAGEAKPIEAAFPSIMTNGIRLRIEDSKGSSWGDLRVTEFHVYGPSQELKPFPDANKALTISTGQEMNILPLGEPISVESRIVNPDKAAAHEFSVQSEWLDYYLRPVAACDSRTVSLGAGEQKTLEFDFTPREQGAYFCRVSLRLKGALVNETLLLCGSRDPDILNTVKPFAALKPQGEPSPEALTGEGKILWSTEMYHQSARPHFLPGPAHFRELKKAGGNLICAMPTWAAVEPLPGIYNFAYYDHCLRLAEEYGLRLELGLWNYNFGREHKWWLQDEYARDADGKVGTGVNRMFSLAGPKNQAGRSKRSSSWSNGIRTIPGWESGSSRSTATSIGFSRAATPSSTTPSHTAKNSAAG